MKCRFRFPIEGILKVDVTEPIQVRSWRYDFDIENGILRSVTVTVPLAREHWPNIQRTSSTGQPQGEHSIALNTVWLPFVRMELRTVEGLLSLYGVTSIDTRHPEIEWVPENEDEARDLKLHRYSSTPVAADLTGYKPFSFAIVRNAVLSTREAHGLEIPLEFFRRGNVDMENQNFIEAVYDYFFVLETMFGEGKFKKAQVIDAFTSSEALINHIRKVVSDPGEAFLGNPQLATVFSRKYGDKSVEEIVSTIVDLRGLLHHHTLKRKDRWDPKEQHHFELEAALLQVVTFHVLAERTSALLFPYGGNASPT